MKTVIEIKTPDYGTIIHRLADGTQKQWAAIRAGLSMPTQEANGYFAIMAEEWTGGGTRFEGEKPKRGKLRLLSEQEIKSPFLNDTLRPFTDECSLVGCRRAYTAFEENKPEEESDQQVLLAQEFLYEQAMGITLYPAPYHKNFMAGVDIIRSFFEKALLELPKDSLANQQLINLAQGDLAENPEVRFIAINALRFVIASFYQSPPDLGRPYRPKRPRGEPYNVRQPRR